MNGARSHSSLSFSLKKIASSQLRFRARKAGEVSNSGEQSSGDREHLSMYDPTSAAAEKGMASCLGRAAVPVKRVWRGLSARLGRRHRRTTTYVPVNPDRDEDAAGLGGVLVGLGRLRTDVRSCEYRDVHVMWEMLSGTGGGDHVMADDHQVVAPPKRRRARKPAAAPWSRLVTYCCGAF